MISYEIFLFYNKKQKSENTHLLPSKCSHTPTRCVFFFPLELNTPRICTYFTPSIKYITFNACFEECVL